MKLSMILVRSQPSLSVRHKSWRKLAQAVLCLLTVAVVAQGCRGPEAGGDLSTNPDGNPDVDVAEAPEGDGIPIRMWIAFTDYRLDWAREKAAEFNQEYPEYAVTVEGYPDYETLFDSALLASEQGNPPAIMHFFEAATQEIRDAVNPAGDPLVTSVAAAVGDRSEINGVPVILDDVVSAPRNYYSRDGEFESMPWNTSSTVLFSNADVLEAAGLDEPPSTWADVEAACEQILALDDGPEHCITWPNHSWFVEQSLAQQDQLLANQDNGRSGRADEVFLNSDGMTAFMGWWKDITDQGYYVYTGSQRDWEGTRNAFVGGQVAFLLTSSSDTTDITESGEEAGFGVTASYMPYNQDVGRSGNAIGGATLWLVNDLDSETEDGALMFMNWLNNPENAADWHRITGYIPITNAAIDLLEAEGWYDSNPNSKVASDQLEDSASTPATVGVLVGNFVAIRDVVTSAAEQLLVGQGEVDDVLDAANQQANRLLDDYNALQGE
jgi:sn-glycerol 3-phosphate transport system substrate-binding protein